eukprot:371731-Pyramimonas_sp.AAC.1
MKTSAGQNTQTILGYPPQDAREQHPTITKNIRTPSPNRPRSYTAVRPYSVPVTLRIGESERRHMRRKHMRVLECTNTVRPA